MPFCPECGHEISDAAIACPNCGRPIRSTPVVDEVVVQPPPARDSDIPKWVYIPVAVIGGLALLLLFILFVRNSQNDNTNVDLKVSANRRSTQTRETNQSVPPTGSGEATLPPNSPANSQTLSVPETSVETPQTRGSVALTARVAIPSGQTVPVKNERFYLLDEDIETILSEASIDPIEGNSLTGSFGLSVLYPERYGDFNRRALSAIRPHIKYSATSDQSGKTEFADINPNQYYLFGVTRGDRGFALWNSPVVIRAGINSLDLAPQPVTEISRG